MAHQKKRRKIRPAPGWERDEQDSHAQRERRNVFLRAAFEASPALTEDCHTLAPLIKEARAALVGEPEPQPPIERTMQVGDGEPFTVEIPQAPLGGFLSWPGLASEVALIEHGVSRLPPAVQRTVTAAHQALTAWATEYHLRAEWVLADVWRYLLRPDPLTPRFYSTGGHVPMFPGSNDFRIEVQGWSGYESAATWLEETQAHILQQLKAHIALTEAQLSAAGYVPIKVRKGAGLEYVELAARWQVLGQSWSDFLQAEKEPDGRERDARNLRSKILAALRYVGIEPRPGMKSNPGTTE